MKIVNAGKTARIVIFFISIAIIVMFAMTGSQGGAGGPDSVAKVEDNSIKIADYQREFQAQLDRYSKAFGGKPLTAQQIKMFRVKEQVLGRLIDKAVMENMTDEMNIKVGKDEVKIIIKDLPYFKTDEKFNVNLYRNLLAQNRLTPQGFEDQISRDTSVQKMIDVVRSFSAPTNYSKDLLRFKNMGATVNAVKIQQSDVADHIKISDADVSKLLKDESQLPILKNFYESLRADYNKPAEVKARHILIKDPKGGLTKAQNIRKKLTTSNFAKIAGKETQDDSGKGAKGGDLGWFSKGRMVPAFEKVAFTLKPGSISKPVKTEFGYHIIYVEKKKKAVNKTFDQVKKDIAKKHIQKTSIDKKKELYSSVLEKLSVALKANKISTVKSIAKKYDLQFFAKTKLNLFDQKIDTITLDNNDIKQLFSKEKPADYIEKAQGAGKVLISVSSRTSTKDLDKVLKDKLTESSKTEDDAFKNYLSSEVINFIKEKSSVVKYDRLL